MIRLLAVLSLIVLLAACGAAQPTTQAPVEITRVVTQVVPQVVTQVATQIIVVTATPQPTVPTVAATPTATPAPTAVPSTATPEPTAAPSTVAIEPTTAPLVQGETVPGHIVRTIRVFDIPNEFEGHEVISTNPGDTVDVLYRGGQWYEIQCMSSKGEVQGWVYRDWISIKPEDDARLQPYPGPLPVIVTKITQTVGNDWKKYWTGEVMNIGAKAAYDVQVEISLTGQIGDTHTRAAREQAFVAARNLEPGQVSTFRVQTEWMSGDKAFYTHRVLWTER